MILRQASSSGLSHVSSHPFIVPSPLEMPSREVVELRRPPLPSIESTRPVAVLHDRESFTADVAQRDEEDGQLDAHLR